MDKRSATTVDRPPNHMADTITGGLNMVLARYSMYHLSMFFSREELTYPSFLAEEWRTLRKTAHAILTPQASAKHLPIQRAEATQLMYDLLKSPQVCLTYSNN